MNINECDPHLEDLKLRSIDRLLMADVYDAAAFEALRAYLCEKARLLQSEYTISKQVLRCLLEARSAIESRAEYLPEVRQHLGAVAAFEQILAAIVAGESCEARSPGIPRIV